VTHPESLGKYRITEVLGEGAMGVVYKGFDPGIQRVVALKTVRRQLMESSEFGATMAARFRNEAQAAGRLSHPGIVSVFDFGDEGDVAYIAMEYVEGASLERYIANKVRFTDEDIVSVIVQLLDALEHAHGQGVWHRDIKPANILMTRAGRLKVADFGIARIEAANLTQVNTMIGTPSYMAPEQFLGGEIDRRVDIYGTGVLLYQLLVGRPPFVGTPEALMYQVVHEAPVLPSAVPGYQRSASFDSVLATALAKDPKLRFPTAAAFKQALTAMVGAPVQATVSDQTIIAIPPRRPAAAAGEGSRMVQPAGATQWDQAVLAQVELSLAKHVGPLAAVLVKRTARECDDLQTLYAKLADQVTNPAARNAFISQSAQASTGGTRRGTTSSGTALASAGTMLKLDESLLAQVTKLLAQHVGPIASVLVKRSALKANGRDAFFALLTDAVPDAAAREKLRADLARLP